MIKVKKDNWIKYIPNGFSWTTLFFGCFPAFLRGDIKCGLIIFFLDIFTGGLARIVFSFSYNRTYLENLLEDGWVIIEEMQIVEEIKTVEEVNEVGKNYN